MINTIESMKILQEEKLRNFIKLVNEFNGFLFILIILSSLHHPFPMSTLSFEEIGSRYTEIAEKQNLFFTDNY